MMTAGSVEQIDTVRKGIDIRRVIVSSAIGSTVEWYDFFIFATASVLVFNQVFYPSFDPLIGTLIALSTYAAGFIARPFGGFVFGYLGDTRGRKVALVTTLLISGLATFAVGLLPTYATIGIVAPMALLVVRLLHGFSIGGEQANAILIACEYAPPARRGLFGSWVQIGAPLGYVLPLGLFAILTRSLPSAEFIDWGWRVPFLLAGLLVMLGLYIRLHISESPEFIRARQRRQSQNSPLKAMLKNNRRELLLGCGAKLSEGVVFTVYAIVIVAYAVSRGVSKGDMTTGVLLGLVLEAFLLPCWGALSDRFGRRALYFVGVGASLVVAPIVFYAVYLHLLPLIWFGLIVSLAVGHGAMYGAQAAFFTEMFPVERRASAVSFVQQIGSLLGSALALLSGWLLKAGDGAPWPLVGYVVANLCVTLICVALLPETAPRKSKPGSPA
jgi:MHS family shikimate/dehydroshikimate transporter-like MFS transporter